ncbi:hypothetical protein LTR84_001340 [Exophiala bonariae]|uniref:AB hydrolase-1 domain-containing protein n=1 Tax=Exophiala bonariae TaxID=1690606 RepID=A0AAV9NDI7_9EURO|nr:hypothetical protein LTR84_001340 [Exophiala bonariae]
MSTLPTLICLHGGFHGPGYWGPLVSLLADKGFRSITPHLLFGGTDKPIQSLEPVIEQVAKLVAEETSKGKDVVMINHSFGSFAGCSAIKGFTSKDPSKLSDQNSGKALGIITISGFFPEHEVSLAAMAAASRTARGAPDPATAPQLPFKPTEEGLLEYDGDPVHSFYNDLPLQEAQKWAAELENMSQFVFATGGGVYAGWMDVPVWYLLCEADNMMELPQQQSYVKKARDSGGDVTTREIDAGHSPMLSRPVEVAKFVQEAVASFSR